MKLSPIGDLRQIFAMQKVKDLREKNNTNTNLNCILKQYTRLVRLR